MQYNIGNESVSKCLESMRKKKDEKSLRSTDKNYFENFVLV